MKHFIKFFKFFFFFLAAFLCLDEGVDAQIHPLSEEAEISLITSSPGKELYTSFGHSALRVQDPGQQLDIVLNYGTFDFHTPDFYQKFIRGKLDYVLSVATMADFAETYRYENRTLYEQVFNLDLEQKQAIFNFLQENYRPQNRYYKYDFFFDNCATRIRDVLEQILGESLVFEYDEFPENLNFRDLLDIYTLKQKPWADFGMDLILGLPSDRIANHREYLFLPDFLLLAFNHAKIKTEKGSKPLVGKNQIIFKADPQDSNSSFFISPLAFTTFLLFLIVSVTLINLVFECNYWLLDGTLFGMMGLIGIFFLFCWFGTDHQVLPKNLNMLWAFPPHLLVTFLFFKKSFPKLLKIYFLLTGIAMLALIAGWKFNPQHYHFAVFPILVLLAIRAFHIAFYLHKRKVKL